MVANKTELEQIVRFADGRWSGSKRSPGGFLEKQPKMVGGGKVFLLEDPDGISSRIETGIPDDANAYEVLHVEGADNPSNPNYGRYAVIFYKI